MQHKEYPVEHIDFALTKLVNDKSNLLTDTLAERKNIFNQTSDKNVYIIGEAARNAGAKISFYEGQLTGFLLNKNLGSFL